SLDEIYRGKGCPWEDAKEVVNQLLDAVAYLHENMVVHRDINPSNVLVEEESGRVVLIDFGAAKKGFTSLPTGSVIGTPGYMAPEQNLGCALPQSDIYALSRTIYFLLTGEDPKGVPSEDELRSVGVPREVIASLLRASSPDLSKRHSSAMELRNEIFYRKSALEEYDAYLVIGSSVFPITDELSIGRGEDVEVDVQIDDPNRYISRLHCTIKKIGNQYYLLDNESTNGTYIWNEETSSFELVRGLHPLSDGDIIGLAFDPNRWGPYLVMTFRSKIKESL
ncbi:MAG TPA: FHA domain-containing protein, partial [Euryarchaeota archaeon]|nr:FHA domain-containing protein [Euryarchaeota archaeon]